MTGLRLFLGNKNYSSWSMRPWIALKVAGIEFEEEVVPFDFENGNPEFRRFSPTMKVPVLQDNGLTVWDSLAILEYAADRFPEKALWPMDQAERARARSISAEMHAGFPALRAACPMNMKRAPETLPVSDEVKADVARIVAIWNECLEQSGGPFLFGGFTIADAMYAPVVSRFETYGLSTDPAVARYIEAVTGLAAWKEWREAALQEPWTVAVDEA